MWQRVYLTEKTFCSDHNFNILFQAEEGEGCALLCENGGQCVAGGRSYCLCPTSYEGTLCQFGKHMYTHDSLQILLCITLKVFVEFIYWFFISKIQLSTDS